MSANVNIFSYSAWVCGVSLTLFQQKNDERHFVSYDILIRISNVMVLHVRKISYNVKTILFAKLSRGPLRPLMRHTLNMNYFVLKRELQGK